MKARDALKKSEEKTDAALTKLTASGYTFIIMLVVGIVGLILWVVL